MIQFTNVTRYYDNHPAVKEANFAFHGGRITGLLGPNGAGKTTIIRLLLQIIPPDSGYILIDGVSPSADFSNRIGFVPEEFGVYKRDRVIDVFMYLSRLRNAEPVTARARFIEILEYFGVAMLIKKRGADISKGQVQIMQIAIALASDPDILVLDEPFTGLDPANQEKLSILIHKLKSRNKYILLSTHQLENVDNLIDDIILLDKGKVLFSGGRRDFSLSLENNYFVEFEDIPTEIKETEYYTCKQLTPRTYQIFCKMNIEFDEIAKSLMTIGKILVLTRTKNSIKQQFLKLTEGS